MLDFKGNNIYVIICVFQSLVIIALAFYMGSQKTTIEEYEKESERNKFELQMNANQLVRLKGQLDTCGVEK